MYVIRNKFYEISFEPFSMIRTCLRWKHNDDAMLLVGLTQMLNYDKFCTHTLYMKCIVIIHVKV